MVKTSDSETSRPQTLNGAMRSWAFTQGYYVFTAITILSAALGVALALRGQAQQRTALENAQVVGSLREAIGEFRHLSIELISQAGMVDSPEQVRRVDGVAMNAIAQARQFSSRLQSQLKLNKHSSFATDLRTFDSSTDAAAAAIGTFRTAIRPSSFARTLVARSERMSKALNGVTKDQIELSLKESSQNANWLFALCLFMFASSLAKNLLVFRPMQALTLGRQKELEQSKSEIEGQLKEITLRSAELQQQRAGLQEQLDDVQVISENFRMATFRLQQVLSYMPIACIGIDVQGRVYEWNEAAQQTFGYAQFDLFETILTEAIIGPEDREIFDARIQEAIEQDQPITFELPTVGKDGQRAMVEWNMMPMRGLNGEVSSLQLTANDITERVLQADKLKDLAFKDALTGLCNRRSFLDTLQQFYPETSPSNPCAVILMDVDKFKNYNDSYGHPEGDALLRRVGELMSTLVPEPFLPARYGGEEFIVFLSGADVKQAFILAETLREAIESQTQDLHGATASFGVSGSLNADVPATEMIEQADKALYYSKHMGRNRTSVWSPELGHDSQAA